MIQQMKHLNLGQEIGLNHEDRMIKVIKLN